MVKTDKHFRTFLIVALFQLLHWYYTPLLADDEMRWEEAEKLVKKIRFSQLSIDSIKEFNNIDHCHVMGTSIEPPFSDYEKLVFEVRWAFILVGYIFITAKLDKDHSFMTFQCKVVSGKFLSLFCKIRDYIYCLADAQGLYPLQFEQHLSERGKKIRRWTLFDHCRGRVYDGGYDLDPYHPPPPKTEGGYYEVSTQTRDYITVLYYLRTLSFKSGDQFTINCFFRGNDHPTYFNVFESDEIEFKTKIFQCLEIRPDIHGEAGKAMGFKKRDKLSVWVTNNKQHIPVYLKAKVSIGSVRAKLIHYE